MNDILGCLIVIEQLKVQKSTFYFILKIVKAIGDLNTKYALDLV